MLTGLAVDHVMAPGRLFGRSAPVAPQHRMALRIGASGLRSSCDSVAMNLSFARAESRRTSPCLPSVMSMTTPKLRTGRPCASYAASPRKASQTWLPSGGGRGTRAGTAAARDGFGAGTKEGRAVGGVEQRLDALRVGESFRADAEQVRMSRATTRVPP